jgi:hypothetical protein
VEIQSVANTTEDNPAKNHKCPISSLRHEPADCPVVTAEVAALVVQVTPPVLGESDPVDVLTKFIVDVPLPQPIRGVNVVTSRSLYTLCVMHC